MFTSNYSFFDADYYNPFENVKKDEHGPYVVLENGRKVRFPSLLNMRVKIANREIEEDEQATLG